MATRFWDLCVDLIIELCSYFSVDELFYTFYPDVFPDLFLLLAQSYTKLHLSLTNDELLTATVYSLINIDQIISLRLINVDIDLNGFQNVKTLTLHNVRDAKDIIRNQHILPSLQRLRLIYSDGFYDLVETGLQSALQHPTLKYLELNLSNNSLTLSNFLGRSSSIEQCVLNGACSFPILTAFLRSLPHLRILRIKTIMDVGFESSRNNIVSLPPAPLICYRLLQTLDLKWYHPSLINIITFLSMFPNLRCCCLSGIMESNGLNGKIWHKIMTEICKNSVKINLSMLVWTGTETDDLKMKFFDDEYFQNLGFQLIPKVNDEHLLILTYNQNKSYSH